MYISIIFQIRLCETKFLALCPYDSCMFRYLAVKCIPQLLSFLSLRCSGGHLNQIKKKHEGIYTKGETRLGAPLKLFRDGLPMKSLKNDCLYACTRLNCCRNLALCPLVRLCVDEMLVCCYNKETIDDTVQHNRFCLRTFILKLWLFKLFSTI